MFKRLLITLTLITSISTTVLVPAISAQEWWRPSQTEFSGKVGTDVTTGGSPATEIFGERYTYAQVVWIIRTLTDFGIGDILQLIPNEYRNEGADASSESPVAVQVQQKRLRPGLIMSLAGYSDSFRRKPASGVEYVAQKFDQINPVNSANAQGYGYTQTLLPIQGLWLAARNAAYLLMTFVVVVLAFMIMLRQKISAQVVITAQSALPKVAVGLIFITFSYAIAGFIVDLGFVVQALVSALVTAVLTSNNSSITAIQVFQQVNNGTSSILAYGLAFILSAFSNTGGIIANVVNGGTPFLDTLFDAVLTLGGTLDFILGLIVALLLILALFRIFFLLLVTYVKFVLTVIAGPFIALMSVVGIGGGMMGWIRTLAAQMSIFVSIGLLVLFAHVFFWGFGNEVDFPPATGLSPLLGNAPLQDALNIFQIAPIVDPSIPAGNVPSGFSFGNNVSAIGFFVSLVVMISIPKLARAVHDQIQTGRGAYGFDIAGAYGPVGNFAGNEINRRSSIIANNAKMAGQAPEEYAPIQTRALQIMGALNKRVEKM